MADLKKIIKVTAAQYDVLASGGRVGDYVGLNDDYIYLIKDTNTYITSAGGTINGDLNVNGQLTISDLTNIPLLITYNDDGPNPYFAQITAYNDANEFTRWKFRAEHIEDDSDWYLNLPLRNGSLATEEWIHQNFQPKDADLTAIANLSGAATGLLRKTAANTWTLDTNNYATVSQIPTVNNATLTISQNNSSVGTFTANASSNVTINITTPPVKRFISDAR